MKKTLDINIQRRITIILFFFLIALLSLFSRFFILQIVHYKDYSFLAARQYSSSLNIAPERGIILVQDKNAKRIPIALNQSQKALIASPKHVQDPEVVSKLLSTEFGLTQKDIFEKLSKSEDQYEVIIKKVGEEQAQKISEKRLPGFFFEEEKHRIYPQNTLASHILGFVSVDKQYEVGKYGLEKFYNNDLSRQQNFFEGLSDSENLVASFGKKIINPPKNGFDIVTTIDLNIQLKTQEIIKKAVEKWQATSGTTLVLEPDTGKILAGESYPSFNPNEFYKIKNFSLFLNPLIEAFYEFGSVLKPITMAAGIEEKKINPTSVYEDKGEIKIKGYTIRNFDEKAYGFQTITQVLEKSLNTGAVHVARLIGKDIHKEYLRKFGLGEKSGVDLPGEVSGKLSHLEANRDIDFATASFGQGLAITPIQLASAIGAIANGGNLMKPYVVEKIIDGSGNEIIKKPEIRRNVISRETSEALTKMLVSAVKNGFENRAGIKGYFVAGKTGTAQIPKKEGRGYSDKVIHTFVGYAPAFRPKFLILLQLNEPKGNRFAANTLTQPFHDLAEYILNYYEVPPDEK